MIATTAGGEDTDAVKTMCLYHGLTILPLVASCQLFVCNKPKLTFIYSSDNRTLQKESVLSHTQKTQLCMGPPLLVVFFLTEMHPLAVKSKEPSSLPRVNHCQGQLQTRQ